MIWSLEFKKSTEHSITSTQKKLSPRNIVLVLSKIKDKDRILRAAREKKTVTYKGKPIRLSSDFLAQTLQVERNGVKYLNY